MELFEDDLHMDLDAGPDLVHAGHEFWLSPMHQEALEALKSNMTPSEKLEIPRIAQQALSRDEGIYKSLNSSLEMRVLELYPGKFNEEIRCSLHLCAVELDSRYKDPSVHLHHVFLYQRTTFVVSRTTGKPVSYTALSYVWGDSAFTKPIVCDGKPFHTTRNLDAALRHLRHPEDSIMLWADQICINQEDLAEKTQQVLLMSKIYERARSTVVWLGVEADNSNRALETLLAVNYGLRFQVEERAPDLDDFERLGLPRPGADDWADLRKFLDRPWFHRVWIIQEVVLQWNVQLVCGFKCFRWEDLDGFSYVMIKYDMEQFLYPNQLVEEGSAESGCVRIRMISDIKNYHQSLEQNSRLLTVLREGRGAKATNLRDKVFGVMGMSYQVVYPDYQRPVADVYKEACMHCLNAGDVIRLLCCVDHEQPPLGTPSWVPDWSTPRQTISLGAKVYKAATTYIQFPRQHLPSLRIDDEKLVMEGMVFDTVTKICGPIGWTLRDLLVGGSTTKKSVLQCVRMALDECHGYTLTTGLFEAFWNTLVAGKDHSDVLKAPSDYADIFALLLDTANGGSPCFSDQPQTKRKLTLKSLESRRPHRIYRETQIAYKAAVRNRIFGVTEKRYMGLLPRGTQIGDQVCVFKGGPLPFVVRRRLDRDEYLLIGECYIHGIMNGEILQMEGIEWRDIVIA